MRRRYTGPEGRKGPAVGYLCRPLDVECLCAPAFDALLCFWLSNLSSQALAIPCSSPSLKEASGVIGNRHKYTIAGECILSWKDTEKTSFFGLGGSATSTNYSLSFSYIGKAKWDRISGKAEETLNFSGDASGTQYAVSTCSQDPFSTIRQAAPRSRSATVRHHGDWWADSCRWCRSGHASTNGDRGRSAG